jgi:hypothetical protein
VASIRYAPVTGTIHVWRLPGERPTLKGRQTPSVQYLPGVQMVPQAPQFALSVCWFAQYGTPASTPPSVVPASTPPSGGVGHSESGAAQPGTHEPAEQMRAAGHAAPHAPQFASSVWVSAQYAAPPSRAQSDEPVGHVPTHEPATQAWPEAQTLPHRPQFVGSVVRSVQNGTCPVGMHSCRFAAHWVTQSDCAQTWPALHTVPHWPQLRASFARSMQTSSLLTVHVE